MSMSSRLFIYSCKKTIGCNPLNIISSCKKIDSAR